MSLQIPIDEEALLRDEWASLVDDDPAMDTIGFVLEWILDRAEAVVTVNDGLRDAAGRMFMWVEVENR